MLQLGQVNSVIQEAEVCYVGNAKGLSARAPAAPTPAAGQIWTYRHKHRCRSLHCVFEGAVTLHSTDAKPQMQHSAKLRKHAINPTRDAGRKFFQTLNQSRPCVRKQSLIQSQSSPPHGKNCFSFGEKKNWLLHVKLGLKQTVTHLFNTQKINRHKK